MTGRCGCGFGQATRPLLGPIADLSKEDLGHGGEGAQSLSHKS